MVVRRTEVLAAHSPPLITCGVSNAIISINRWLCTIARHTPSRYQQHLIRHGWLQLHCTRFWHCFCPSTLSLMVIFRLTPTVGMLHSVICTDYEIASPPPNKPMTICMHFKRDRWIGWFNSHSINLCWTRWKDLKNRQEITLQNGIFTHLKKRDRSASESFKTRTIVPSFGTTLSVQANHTTSHKHETDLKLENCFSLEIWIKEKDRWCESSFPVDTGIHSVYNLSELTLFNC